MDGDKYSSLEGRWHKCNHHNISYDSFDWFFFLGCLVFVCLFFLSIQSDAILNRSPPHCNLNSLYFLSIPLTPAFPRTHLLFCFFPNRTCFFVLKSLVTLCSPGKRKLIIPGKHRSKRDIYFHINLTYKILHLDVEIHRPCACLLSCLLAIFLLSSFLLSLLLIFIDFVSREVYTCLMIIYKAFILIHGNKRQVDKIENVCR